MAKETPSTARVTVDLAREERAQRRRGQPGWRFGRAELLDEAIDADDVAPLRHAALPRSPSCRLRGSGSVGDAGLGLDQVAIDGGGDLAELRHERGEVLGRQRLRAVGERLVRARVDLDDQAVGAGGDGGQRQRADVAATCRCRGWGRRSPAGG